MKNQFRIIEKYNNKVLATRSWGDAKKFYIQDFLNLETLFDLIYEIESREADFLPEGIEFIKEYYGIRNLAEALYKENPKYPRESILGNELFLEQWGFKSFPPEGDFSKFTNIYDRYKDKKMGRNKAKAIKANDLMNAEDALTFLRLILKNENDITKEGYQFLNDFFGLGNLLRFIIWKDHESAYLSEEELEHRIKSIREKLENKIYS